MEGCLTRLVPVDINRSGKATMVRVLCLALSLVACLLGGLDVRARKRAAERDLLLVIKSLTKSLLREVRHLGDEYLRANRVLMEPVCGGLLARQVSRACGWGCGHDLFYRPRLEHLWAADDPRLDKAYYDVPATKCTYTHRVKFKELLTRPFSSWPACPE